MRLLEGPALTANGMDGITAPPVLGEAVLQSIAARGDESCEVEAIEKVTVPAGSLVVSCGTQHSQSLVVVEPGGHVGRLHLSLSTCPWGGAEEWSRERCGRSAVHQRAGFTAALAGR